jgi:hypothetical protein
LLFRSRRCIALALFVVMIPCNDTSKTWLINCCSRKQFASTTFRISSLVPTMCSRYPFQMPNRNRVCHSLRLPQLLPSARSGYLIADPSWPNQPSSQTRPRPIQPLTRKSQCRPPIPLYLVRSPRRRGSGGGSGRRKGCRGRGSVCIVL